MVQKYYTQKFDLVLIVCDRFPFDNETYQIHSQFLWGPAFLIAPVLKEVSDIFYLLYNKNSYKLTVETQFNHSFNMLKIINVFSVYSYMQSTSSPSSILSQLQIIMNQNTICILKYIEIFLTQYFHNKLLAVNAKKAKKV